MPKSDAQSHDEQFAAVPSQIVCRKIAGKCEVLHRRLPVALLSCRLALRHAGRSGKRKESKMGIARNRGNLCQVLTAALLLMGSTPYAKADAGKGAPIPLQAAIPAGETLLVPRPARAEPARAPQASIRQLETDEAVSGSEPDPEAFDRRGLETWWRHYQDTLKKAE